MRFCMVYEQYQIHIYCIHLFLPLFTIPSQSIIGKILPNFSQRRLEKPLLIRCLGMAPQTKYVHIGI